VKASRHVRAGGALGHLLLVAVLALGIFTMHTLGHPDTSHDSAMSAASHATTMDAAAVSAAADIDAGMGSHPEDHGSPSTDQPGMAMDMQSLCLAVLFGVWVLAALIRSAFARHEERLAALLAQVAAVPRPGPPPRGPDLTRLSVLRL
jgi:hypothetical protein